jgi:hypothetical protein
MVTRLAGLRAGMGRRLGTGAALLVCVTLTGCIGAAPLRKRTRTPEGTEVKDVDLTFIHPGQTTRAEVREKLKLLDAGYTGDRFFLGRWSSSTWGGWAIVVGMDPGALGGGGRVWKSGNLLVEFDEAGVVKRSEPFDDRKAVRMLTAVAENMPLQLTAPLELPVKYWKNYVARVPAKIVLSAGSLDFEELSDQKKKDKFSIPARDVRKVEIPLTMAVPDPTYVGQRIHCARDLRKLGGPRGKDLNLEVTLPQMVTLMSYAAQAGKAQASGAAGETVHK